MVHGSGKDPALLLPVATTTSTALSGSATTATPRRATAPPTSVSTSSTSGGVSGSCIHIVLLVLYPSLQGETYYFRQPVPRTTTTSAYLESCAQNSTRLELNIL